MMTETLPVPGASLYYEVRGSGPVLLMIPGGPMDADGFKQIAERLHGRHVRLPRQFAKSDAGLVGRADGWAVRR
jgi:pimeloyl-ACP methyl ester carboxylesterase